LLKVPVLKTFIKKLGYIPIDKLDGSKAIEDIEIIKANIKKGKSILLFPEGTFGFSEGLRPFKLGAFKIAVDMEVPICPIAISGLRYTLRGNSWLLKRNPLSVVCGEPIYSHSHEWSEVVRLKNDAYSFILEHAAEPRLDFVIAQLSAFKNSGT
jgi:1-acyl-sn-glycerol-3-phosphate acyltransferase